MRVKILKRSSVVKNSILFLIIGLAYYYIATALSQGNSAFSVDLLDSFIFLNKPIFYMWSIVLVATYFMISLFDKFFLAYHVYLNIKIFSLFLIQFDKTILIINLIFLVISYFFYLILREERGFAVYNPSFHSGFIGKKSEYDIPAKLEYEGKSLQGYLTNWDNGGVFIFFENFKKIHAKKVNITIEFEGSEFVSIGELRTCYDNGYGITLLNDSNKYNWFSLFEIIKDRGLKPRYI